VTHACVPRADVAACATVRGADVVRPFAGWLVRAEAAGDEVDAMSEVAAAVRSTPRKPRISETA